MPTYDGIGETITHKLEIEGDLFLQDIEGGPNSTQVPLEIFSNFHQSSVESANSRMLRLRVQNAAEANVSNSYVTDFGIRGEPDKDYFFITAPQNTSNVGDQNTFVISKTSNVGIGTTDPGHYRLLVNNSSTKHFGVPGNDTPTTGDTLVYNENGEWVYSFPAGNLPAGTINNEILTWNGVNWVPNHSMRTTDSNTSIGIGVGIGTFVPGANLHVIGSVTATSDVDISGKFQGGKLRVGSLLSAVPTNPNVTVPGDLTVSGTLTSDEWIHTDDITITGNIDISGTITTSNIVGGSPLTISTGGSNVQILNSNVGIGTTDPTKTLEVVGDIKCQTLSASTITGASPLVIQSDETIVINAPVNTGTMTVSNIFHSDQLTMSANVFVTEGRTLTLSNIFHTDQLTMTSNIIMGSDKTLTTSNIVANTGDNLLVSSNLEVGTSNLFVDTATGRVGIGTTSPDKLLTLGFSINSSSSIQFQSDLNIIRQLEADRDAYFSSLENSIQRYADINTPYSAQGPQKQISHAIRFGYSDDYNTYTSDTPNTYYPSYHETHFDLWNSTSGSASGSLKRVMTLRGNGNVGIGTTDTSAQLTMGYGTIFIKEDRSTTASRNWTIRTNNSNEGDFQIGNSGSNTGGMADFHANSTQAKITISGGGNVGIGVVSPGAPLEVVSTRNADTWSSGASQLNVLNYNGAGSWYGMSLAVSQTRGNGIIQTFNKNSGSAQYNLELQPVSGNVGIGTTGPWAGLHQYRSVSLTYVGNICGGVAFNSWNTGIINLSTTNRVIFMIIFTPDSGEYWSGIVTMSQVYPPNPDWNTFRNTTNASLYYRYDSCGNPYLGFRNGSTTQTPYMCAIVLH